MLGRRQIDDNPGANGNRIVSDGSGRAGRQRRILSERAAGGSRPPPSTRMA
jgi:hypothetical protein